MLSPDQLRERLDGITATDVAAIIGCNPWRSAIDVWLEKTGQAEPFVGNLRTRWGDILEGPIRNDYAERHSVRIEVPGTLSHPTRAWQKATPDGLVYQIGAVEADRGIEIKVHGREAMMSGVIRYGDQGTDDVPQHELVQCMWGMKVTGLSRWDLIAFTDGAPIEYVIERDDELLAMLEDRAERFLVDNVRGGMAPEPDGSASYDNWIASRFKARNTEGQIIPIDHDGETRENLDKLRDVRRNLAAFAKLEAALEQAIKLAIGDHAGIEFPNPSTGKRERVTYRQAKDSTSTDFEAAFAQIRTSLGLVGSGSFETVNRAVLALDKLNETHFANTRATITGAEIRELIFQLHNAITDACEPEIVAAHTKTVPGSRRFCVPRSWK